jgi:hypothetical protein
VAARNRDVLIFGSLALALRVVAIVRYRIDSDEPQHLHTVWMWSRGLIGYRDFYDNHTPLFHMLMAPLLSAAGETAHVFLIGRMAMLPIAIASLAVLYWIARRLYGTGIAAWSVIAAAVLPPVLLKSVEFRNDNLWVLCCLLILGFVIAAPLTPRRAATVGVLLAISLMTSIKTVFFAAALAIAIAMIDGVTMPIVLAAAAGFLVPIAALLGWFASNGALHDLLWCVVKVNGELPVSAMRRAEGVALAALVVVGVLRYIRTRPCRREVAIAAATTIMFMGCVEGLSLLISPRDMLPGFWMAAMFGVAMLAQRPLIMRAAVASLMLFACTDGELLRAPDSYPQRLVAEALMVTPPSEPVLDLKGETIFRRRPSYIALEPVGRNALVRGIVRETFIDDVIARRCHVVTRDAPFFPPATRDFLNEHFIDVGELRVAGAMVQPDGTFAIAVPGTYAEVASDGSIIARSRWYERGVYRSDRASAVLWQPAVERGFLPESMRRRVPSIASR